MDEVERVFWIAITLWGGVFLAILTAGLFALYEGHSYWGAGFIVLGLGGVIAIARHVKGNHLKLEHAAIAALVVTWVFFGYDIYDRHESHSSAVLPSTAQPTPNPVPSPISGAVDVPSSVASVDVKTDVKMPYQVFCTANWDSSCVQLEQKEGKFTLNFSAPAPPVVGGMAEYRIIPIELKKAYQQDAEMVGKLNVGMAKLQRAIA
jgi:hypothetical protein